MVATAESFSKFGQFSRELHRYLMKRLRRRDDAEDLAQEVYERLLRLPEDKFVEKPLQYLYGTASHVLADHMFAVKHRSHIDWDEDVDKHESCSQMTWRTGSTCSSRLTRR